MIMREQERKRALSVGKITALPVARLGQKCQGSCRNNKVSSSSSGNKFLFNGAFYSAPPVGSVLTMQLQASSSF